MNPFDRASVRTLATMVLGACLAGCAARAAGTASMKLPALGERVDVVATVETGRRTVTEFFGEPFAKPFETKIFEHRAQLDAFAKDRWKMPPSECWVVAMGVGPVMVLLDPVAWKVEACEHDGRNPAEVSSIVTHELVHVFHGQHNPQPEFDGMDDVGWFVEGLAVFASGQLDIARLTQARDTLAAGGAPKDLSSAWSGPARYALCGSLVAYIDHRFGRSTTLALLAKTTNQQILAALALTESELLQQWRESVTATLDDHASRK